MKRRKKIKWSNGAVFGVPLQDESFGIAQAIDLFMPNWVYVALFNYRIENINNFEQNLQVKDIISLVAVSKEELDFNEWLYIKDEKTIINKNEFKNERFKSNGYVGAKTYNAGLAAKFLSAFHCITPWDAWYDPNYLDQFLKDQSLKPKKIKLKRT